MFRLKELRNEIGITRAQLSRAINVNQGTLANYENEIREADYRTLALLADFFDVTIDYLIGFDEKTAPNSTADFKPLSTKGKSILNTYRNLSEKSRNHINDLLNLLSNLEFKDQE